MTNQKNGIFMKKIDRPALLDHCSATVTESDDWTERTGSSSVDKWTCVRGDIWPVYVVRPLSGADFVQHNQKFLSRIYPAGSRTSSSNYNPQEFWNVGSQLGEWETVNIFQNRRKTTRALTHTLGRRSELNKHADFLLFFWTFTHFQRQRMQINMVCMQYTCCYLI